MAVPVSDPVPAATLLRAPDPERALQAALDLAFRYLERRERTELELRRYLEGKRVEPSAIEDALRQLRETGYVDDARFARQFAADKRLLDEWGADRIERRLTALGIAREQVEAALAVQDRDGELAAALALLARRFPQLGEDPRERRRAYGVLVRKGYDAELAWDALREHLAAPASRAAASSPARVQMHATPTTGCAGGAPSLPRARRHPPG